MALCGLIFMVALPATASADHYGTQHYSRSTQDCSPGGLANLVDPIGLVFYGGLDFSPPLGHSKKADFLVESMVDPDHDWRDTDGRDQFVGSGGQCTEMEHEAATPEVDEPDGFPNPARYHLRFNQNASRFPGLRFLTVVTPHYEVDTDECGHVVPAHVPPTSDLAPSGYDYARGHVKNDWVADRGSNNLGDTQNWRNTRQMMQCTGSLSHSSGRVYFLLTD